MVTIKQPEDLIVSMPSGDGNFGYKPNVFVQMYETSGVFLFEEIDAADEEA